jgi:hypothetical protein
MSQGDNLVRTILASVWSPDKDRLNTTNFPPEMDVNFHGNLDGKTAFYYSIMGGRSKGWNTNTTYQDACDYLDNTQDLMNTPTSGQTLYLVSTNANDTAAGTGARTVRTVYLDGSGNQQVRTDTLNGVTAVNIGTGYTAIQWMEVASLGTSPVAIGAINCTSTNGAATVATTFEQIAPNTNRSVSARYAVPAGYSAYVLSFSAASDGPATQDVRLRSNCFADNRALSGNVFHFDSRIFLKGAGDNQIKQLYYMRFPALSTIKVSSLPTVSGVGNKLDAGFKLFTVAT